MRIPLLGAFLKSDIDANGHRVKNLGEPVGENDVVTKKYFEEHRGAPADYNLVRANAAAGANHASKEGNPHGTTFASLPDKPTIPAEVTETTVSGWGFFKGTIETIKSALASVFAAITHGHTKSDITDFPTIPEVVAPASDTDLSGKAADAYETGVKLDGKVRLTRSQGLENADFYVEIRDDGFYLGNMGVSIDQYVKIPFSDTTGTLALVSQLSGITAQDIADFLLYKGELKLGHSFPESPDVETVDEEVWRDDVVKIKGVFYKAVDSLNAPIGFDFFKSKSKVVSSEGFLNLVELYKKNKALLFADTAFSEACAYKLNDADANGVKDRAINKITASEVTIPDGFTDLILSVSGAVTKLIMTGITTAYGDDLPTEGNNLITVTRIAEDAVFVKVVALEDNSYAGA